jgi:4-hydroxy-3-polyprenylbenzoate decarboxylase
MTNKRPQIVVGITGGSGAIYAKRVIDLLAQADCHVHVIFSKYGKQVYQHEVETLGQNLNGEKLIGRDYDHITFHNNDNMFDALASGSHQVDQMVIVPCSTHTMAAMASGLCNTLLLRSAYVTLKERRPLIVVSRETPVTSIDLENMLKLTQAGAIICPASPGFYMKPKTIDDIVDAMASKVLDLLKVPHNLDTRWC